MDVYVDIRSDISHSNSTSIMKVVQSLGKDQKGAIVTITTQ